MSDSLLRLELINRLRRAKRMLERLGARGRYCLGSHRGRDRQPLSESQIETFRRDGYLLASGWVPDETSRSGRQAMLELLKTMPSDAAQRLPRLIKDSRLSDCFTQRCVAAAAQLEGSSPASFVFPQRVYTVNAFPTAGSWRAENPHIDHANPAARHRTSPRPFRVAALLYLEDVGERAGGTAVWPGSHLTVAALRESDPHRFRMMATLNEQIGSLKLGEPIVLTPARGDVLLYHCFCVHSSSTNLSANIRLAINHKW